MKKISTILFISVLLSCGEKKKSDPPFEGISDSIELEKIREAYLEITRKIDSLKKISKSLHERIQKIDPKLILVEYQIAKDTIYKHYVKLQGTIQSKKDAYIISEFPGVITLHVDQGQSVKEGQLVGTISDGGLREQLNQLKIQKDLAQSIFERWSNLWKQKIGSEMKYLEVKTKFEVLKKQVKSIKHQLEKTRLLAPFDGNVEQIMMQTGQVVAPGIPILRLIDVSKLRAVTSVPEKYLSRIGKGTEVQVFFPFSAKRLKSKVILVSASINSENRTFQVEAPLDQIDDGVKPNMNVEMSLNDYTARAVFIVKQSVVKQDAEGKYVFVVEDIHQKRGIVKKKYVKQGWMDNSYVELLNGIKVGDYIVTEFSGRLSEHDNVELVK